MNGLARILLVDDDEVDRLTVRRALRNHSAELALEEALDGNQALEMLRAQPFDCVLLDFQLPGHDGRWVLNEIRAAGMRVPVIMLTGHGDEETAVELMKAGATDYIAKGSVGHDGLPARIRQALRFASAERRLRDAQLAQEHAEGLLRLIVDSLPVRVGYVDANLRYVWNNLAFNAWFQRPREEAVGLHIRDVLGPEVMDQMRNDFDRVLAGTPVHYERELPMPTGSRWVEGSFLPQKDASGKTVGFVVLASDTTERKHHEQAIQRQAEFAQQLIGIVSHDLKNPITAILLNAVGMNRRKNLDATDAGALGRIVNSAERVARLVGDLLDFTQAAAGAGLPITPRESDLSDVVKQSAQEAAAGFVGRDVQVTTEGDLRGVWDADRLIQMTGNLVTNALTYSPDGTPVIVAARDDGEFATISVTNQGEPIPATAMATLFEPFKRGPHEGRTSGQRSVGLGLYIVERIATAHGGSVHVSSSGGAGTCFTIRLPRRHAS